MQSLPIIPIVAIIVAVVAAVIDLKTTKIPNKLTFPAALVGIVLNFALLGWQAGLFAILGWFVGALIMVGLDWKKKMGFGDAKLMAAMGAFLQWKGVLIAWGFFALLYGAVTTAVFLRAFPWQHSGEMAKAAIIGVTPTIDVAAAEKVKKAMETKIALGPVIALGVLLEVFLEKATLHFLGFPG
jgi:prepilin signal peptidase PulO-like enzyme (type II secretory pathway)